MNNNTDTDNTKVKILIGFFEFVELGIENKKLFFTFLFSVIIIISILFYSDYNTNKDKSLVIKYNIISEINKQSSFELLSLDMLDDKLKKAKSYLNTSTQSSDLPVVNLFDTKYLYMTYFEMLNNSKTIKSVLLKYGVINQTTDQYEINNIINTYQKKISKKLLKSAYDENIYNKIILEYNFDNIDYDLEKNIYIDIVLSTKELVREFYLLNIEKIIDQIIEEVTFRRDLKLEKQKDLVMIKRKNDLNLLKIQYNIAKELNIIKPLIESQYETIDSYQSPLFFKLGTEYIDAIIISINDSINRDFLEGRDDSNFQSLISSINEIIDIANIRENGSSFLIDFNIANIQKKITSSDYSQLNNLIKYLITFIIGFVAFIFIIVMKENFRIYKNNK